ncbi:uncharacterized protein LY89DRAFT_731868 [Mollisia scopiformis]|uniref:Uncharacterized protein n=1 Tax=Mollisia scopiformis TaxID=149040 RepID=A0A194XH54_MOLSC|nr:uncharacterized protein LY89DRAFT_731868 [Mollisia scopiformis]KUJ19471.1 hypothetical protein LY89DRAFT_731868 [Mollisia scopiformis]
MVNQEAFDDAVKSLPAHKDWSKETSINTLLDYVRETKCTEFVDHMLRISIIKHERKVLLDNLQEKLLDKALDHSTKKALFEHVVARVEEYRLQRVESEVKYRAYRVADQREDDDEIFSYLIQVRLDMGFAKPVPKTEIEADRKGASAKVAEYKELSDSDAEPDNDVYDDGSDSSFGA